MAGISAVLLAAGESTRMGRPKALLPWDGGTLIGYQVRALAQAGVAETIVVLGHQAVEVAPYVRGAGNIRMLINPHYQKGKTTSIKTGLREVSRRGQHILLLAVDQPRPPELLRLVIQKHLESGALITQPAYQGRGGHPLIFHCSLLPELLEVREETLGVREVLERHRDQLQRVPVDSAIAVLDANTPQDYQRALSLLGARGPRTEAQQDPH